MRRSAGALMGIVGAASVVVAVASACSGTGTGTTASAEEAVPSTAPTIAAELASPDTAVTTAGPPGQRPPDRRPPDQRRMEAAILAAVDGYWQTFLEANDPPDLNHPGLDRYYTGAARAKTLENINTRLMLGRVVRLPTPSVFRSRAVVDAAEGAEASVRNCVVDDSQLIVAATGEVLNGRVSTWEIRLVLELSDADWKVRDNEVNHMRDGVAQCDF